MHILISNDDGYNAPGLLVLTEALKNQHHKVTVVAPLEDKSGCGMGLSLRRSIVVERKDVGHFVVDGTPADCVYLGVNSLADTPVDLVVSGINNGPNLADDVFYSGTFAAAFEARRMELPSIALSVNERQVKHYETAAYTAVQMINAMPHLAYKSLISVLNINLPDVPVASLRGFKATVLSQRAAPAAPRLETEKGDKTKFRLGLAGAFISQKRSVMQDFEAVSEGYGSVTPLSSRFEDRAYVGDVQKWLDSL